MDDPRNNASEEPLYNIGVVSRMTGISVAALRAWDRRYGFPSSGRTAGGHRLYSERDMVRLRWVKDQIDRGVQTAQAIQVLRHHEGSEHPAYVQERVPPATPASPMSESQEDAIVRSTGAAAAPGEAEDLVPDLALAQSRNDLEQALRQYDVATADRILGKALLSYSLDDLIFKVVEPAFVSIGEAWEEGRINVATEHLTTHYLRHRLLMWMLSGPPLYPVKPVLLSCAPGELHEGSLLMLGALLRRRRWPVAYLGQTMPLSDLAALVDEMQPPIIVTVAMTAEPAKALLKWPTYLPEAAETGKPIFAYGGRIFSEQPDWRTRMQGLFLGESLQDGINRLDGLLTRLLAASTLQVVK